MKRRRPALRLSSCPAFLLAFLIGNSTAFGLQVREAPVGLPPLRDVETPSRTPTLLSRASATTTVITGDNLESLGVRFLSDALRITPGIEVQRMSSTESNVSLRSYNDNSSTAQGILGLVDGRQVYNEFFGNVVWDTLPVSLHDVKQIEVIRGPGSFLHGPNAMHGLVSVTTRSPLDYKQNEFFLQGHGGTYRSEVETLAYVRREGDAGIKVKAVHDDINEFDPRDRNSKDKTWGEVRFETLLGSEDHRLDVAAGIGRQKFNVLIPSFAVLPPTLFANEADEGYARASYILEHLKAQVTWTRFDAASTPDQAYTPFRLLLDAADLDLQYSIDDIPDNNLTFGIGYRYAGFETEDSDVAVGSHHTHLGWAFVQDEFKIGDDWIVTGGFRVDDHSTVGMRVSPRLAVVWNFDREETEDREARKITIRDQSLRFTAGYGYRNPSLRELWFDMPVLGGLGTIAGNRELKVEKMRSLELGYWGRPAPWIQVEASVYLNLVDRLMQYDETSPGPPVVYGPKNVNKDQAYGIEAGVEIQILPELFGFANYAFELRYDREMHDHNPTAPRHKANGGFRLTLEEIGLTATAWATFFDGVAFPNIPAGTLYGEADEYALVNARIAKDLPLGKARGKVFVQAFNLLDHDHHENPEGDSYGMILMGGLEVTW